MEFLFLWGLAAYVLGSVPFGLLFSKLYGTPDPRHQGSQNIGFTNVLRVSGKKVGLLTLLGDAGKGLLATAMAGWFGFPWSWMLGIGLIVVLGHVFSIFLQFKGGKGVATAFGTVLGLDVVVGILLIGIWIATVLIFRYSSGGALAAFGIFPVLAYFLTWDIPFCLYALSLLVVIYACHKENILRLAQGTENKTKLFSI